MKETRDTFKKRLKNLSDKDQKLVDFAYDIAKESHRTQKRDGGNRYFEHLRSVTLILVDECKISDPDLIIAALLHDSMEDTGIFGSQKDGYENLKQVSKFRISHIFNNRVYGIVLNVTKLKVDDINVFSKAEAEERYLHNLKKSNPESILIKMCDRLHNLRTLAECTKEKIGRKIKETEVEYYPIFEKILDSKYKKEGKKLFDAIKKEVGVLKKSSVV